MEPDWWTLELVQELNRHLQCALSSIESKLSFTRDHYMCGLTPAGWKFVHVRGVLLSDANSCVGIPGDGCQSSAASV
jgi:hypothetical protein